MRLRNPTLGDGVEEGSEEYFYGFEQCSAAAADGIDAS
jgi:hypothetical protein